MKQQCLDFNGISVMHIRLKPGLKINFLITVSIRCTQANKNYMQNMIHLGIQFFLFNYSRNIPIMLCTKLMYIKQLNKLMHKNISFLSVYCSLGSLLVPTFAYLNSYFYQILFYYYYIMIFIKSSGPLLSSIKDIPNYVTVRNSRENL